MHLRRDYLIKRQLQKNRQNKPYFNFIQPATAKRLGAGALQQLSMTRVKSKQMEYYQIEIFLLAATYQQAAIFYQKLKQCLLQIFNDQKSKQIFQDKWSHSLKRNVVGLFNRIARDYFSENFKVNQIFTKLYYQTIMKLLTEDQLSRIEEKFLDSFLIQAILRSSNLKILGTSNCSEIEKSAEQYRKRVQQKQIPKSLNNCQFLQYCIMSLFKMQLPHEKYLYSQLLHVPNPKFLLPFHRKNSFTTLGSQILIKLNKVDMTGFLYWNYFEYQQRDKESHQLYNRIRKAAGWEAKIDIMLLIIKSKIKIGIEKYMNLINEKIKFYSNRTIDENGINDITSYVQICLQICYKKKDEEIYSALEKVDISQAFQQKSFQDDSRLKDIMLKLVELYLILLCSCAKKSLKLRFITKIVVIIIKLLKNYNQEKFTTDMSNLVRKTCQELADEQRTQFLFIGIQQINREWEKRQQNSNNEIAKINPYILKFIATFAYDFGFEDYGRPDFKVLKLELFFIMALNYKQTSFFQSKKKLSLTTIDINHSLANNNIFNILEIQKKFYHNFQQHLKTIFGDYQLNKPEHQGLLAVIDQIVTFRIQMIKEQISLERVNSFYSFLIDLFQQTERVDPSGNLMKYIKNYFQKCIKAYLIEKSRLKFQDSGKSICVRLLSIDVSFLAEGSISANPLISDFCKKALFEYIDNYPELAFDTRILTVISECISFLYRKSTQQYESKAEKIKGKYLVSNTLIPNRAKDITKRLIFLMTALYQIVLQGHCINQNYLRIRALYLVRQNSKTANITFGWKFLKHIITNFKEDNSFVRNQVLLNNSCAWFINEQFFSKKLKQMKPQKILLDKCLLPLHNKDCDINNLKKISQSVQPQLEIQFLIIPPENTENKIENLIEQLEEKCQKIQDLYCHEKPNLVKIEAQQNKLYDIVSRVKTIYIRENTSLYILSKLMELCRKFNNHELFKYVFLKVVPLLYCMSELSQKFLLVAAQCLHYIVNQYNNVSRLYFQKQSELTNTQDTFHIKSDYFDASLDQYEQNQQTKFYQEATEQLLQTTSLTKRYMVMKLHTRRLYSLQKMYKYFIKFLSSHLHVFVAKGIPLMQLAQIFKISFQIDINMLEFLPLQSIGYCLTSHLQLVNLLKSSVQKGENSYDESFIDDFYYKSLRMGLFHFQKRKTFYQEQLLEKSSITSNLKSLKTKISFFIQICDYLRNDDFHRFRKKKLPKREQIFNKKKNQNMLVSILAYGNNKPKVLQRGDTLSYNQEDAQYFINNNRMTQIDIDMTILRYGLLYMISQQIDRIKAYSFMELNEIENPYSLSGKKKFISYEQILTLHDYLGEKSTILIYIFLKVFQNRIDNPQAIENRIKDTITMKPDYGFPEFLEFYIEHNKDKNNRLKRINYWKPPHIQILFNYLSTQYEKIPYLQLYATKVLSRLRSEQILFYLPQIYQALTLQSGQIVYNFLLEYSKKSASFAHQLIWISKVESKIERDPHNKNPRLPGVDEKLRVLQIRSTMLSKDIIRQFTREQKSFFKEVDEFYEQITSVSGKMSPKWVFAEKKKKIQEQLQKIIVPKSVYLPTNPFFQVIGLKIQSGTPMQSAAKCPFLLTFICKKYLGPDKDFEQRKFNKHRRKIMDQNQMQPIKDEDLPHSIPMKMAPIMGSIFGRKKNQRKIMMEQDSMNKSDFLKLEDIKINIQTPKRSNNRTKNSQKNHSVLQQSQEVQVSCIFKVFDDIRQDSLALQVIQLFMEIFEKHSLELKLFPYKTISNRTGKTLDIGGIIEVVPKTVSRDSIGKTNEQSLYEFFLNNFGAEHNSAFQEARQNFIKSQAAYSIISYILQIKDRHNGNILINKEEGYLVHIDFGFIFDISPANNLRFQRADFKLTQEMVKIMGGKIDSEPFQLYMGLVIKGFLIARKYHQHIMNIIKLMFNSGLPCFLEKSLINVQNRFVLQMSEIQAAQYMKDIILKAADHWTTNWYDKIQWIQQRIYH